MTQCYFFLSQTRMQVDRQMTAVQVKFLQHFYIPFLHALYVRISCLLECVVGTPCVWHVLWPRLQMCPWYWLCIIGLHARNQLFAGRGHVLRSQLFFVMCAQVIKDVYIPRTPCAWQVLKTRISSWLVGYMS